MKRSLTLLLFLSSSIRRLFRQSHEPNTCRPGGGWQAHAALSLSLSQPGGGGEERGGRVARDVLVFIHPSFNSRLFQTSMTHLRLPHIDQSVENVGISSDELMGRVRFALREVEMRGVGAKLDVCTWSQTQRYERMRGEGWKTGFQWWRMICREQLFALQPALLCSALRSEQREREREGQPALRG